MRRLSLCFLLLLLSLPVAGQSPRGSVTGKRFPAPYSTPQLRQYVTEGSFYHQVTVDSGGSGDFATLGAALLYVALQGPPLLQNQWTVLVYPGSTEPSGYSYSETNLTIPPFTNVEGATGAGALTGWVNGRPMIRVTSVSGIGVTLSTASSLTNLGFVFPGALEAGYVGFQAGVGSAITKCVVAFGGGASDVQTDIVKVVAPASVYIESSYIQRLAVNMTNTRHLYVPSGVGIVSSSWLLASPNQAAVVETAGGTVRVLHSRIYGGATSDLKNSSGTLSADFVSHSTESGLITRAGSLTPRISSGGSSLPGSCQVPEIFLDTTGESARLCGCTSADTWRCTPLD